ncbi:MAG: hypothetical protein JXM79_02310 [Sedimentisphaerales bacterium]|nr:hypothetical protein [Sedimentisphaerales bacterium]
MEKRRKRFDAKCEILLGVLILFVIIGLSAATYADSVDQPKNGPSFLDPFELRSVSYVAHANPRGDIAGELFLDDYNRKSTTGYIWIPRRPVCRSSIRPEWTP